jgi:proline iminopeptidase
MEAITYVGHSAHSIKDCIMLNRRAVLGSAAAFIALPTARAEEGKGPLVGVRGTRLFIERYGDPAATPIIYIHGGPGSGSYDAGVYQGLGAVGSFFRGLYATDYALRYPLAVSGLVFKNATFDPNGSLQSLLRACAALMAEKGNKSDSDALLSLAEANVSACDRLLGYVRYSQKLGPDRERLYAHQEQLLDFLPSWWRHRVSARDGRRAIRNTRPWSRTMHCTKTCAPNWRQSPLPRW